MDDNAELDAILAEYADPETGPAPVETEPALAETEPVEPEVRAPIEPTVGRAIAAESAAVDARVVESRALGAFFGQAIADAAALQVEDCATSTIEDRHPTGVNYPSRGAYKGYAPNDWTDATDTTILTARSLTDYFLSKTEDPVQNMAQKLHHWTKNGFSEHGDTGGLTPEGIVLKATLVPGFTHDPVSAARSIRGPKADNGSLIRSMPCAFTAAPSDWATLYSDVTHADDRARAASVAYVGLLSILLNLKPGESPKGSDATAAIKEGCACIEEEHPHSPTSYTRRRDYLSRLTQSTKVASLMLDERDHRSYTLKTLACAMWAYRQLVRTPRADWTAEFFKTTVRAIAARGGDATANCAVVGAILGAAMGIEALPGDWVDGLPHGAWLRNEVMNFLSAAKITWGDAPK